MFRPLKRWRWVGCFSESLMLCAAEVHIGPGRVSWWAVWDRERRALAERTAHLGRPVRFAGDRLVVGDGPVAIDLGFGLDAVDAVEVASRHDGRPIHTVKRAGVPVRGTVRLGDRSFAVDAYGVVDDSWGRHARHTAWRWSAGVGRAASGERVAWNLVEGIHDAVIGSERAVWVDGRARELEPLPFATDLSSVGGLGFTPEAARAHRERLLIVSSDYEAPFGTFAGELPGTGPMTGVGVMERHRATW